MHQSQSAKHAHMLMLAIMVFTISIFLPYSSNKVYANSSDWSVTGSGFSTCKPSNKKSICKVDGVSVSSNSNYAATYTTPILAEGSYVLALSYQSINLPAKYEHNVSIKLNDSVISKEKLPASVDTMQYIDEEFYMPEGTTNLTIKWLNAKKTGSFQITGLSLTPTEPIVLNEEVSASTAMLSCVDNKQLCKVKKTLSRKQRVEKDRKALARTILKSSQKRIKYEGPNPKKTLRATASGKCAPLSVKLKGGRPCVKLDRRVMRAVIGVSKDRGIVISSFTTGNHDKVCSKHYAGRAIDFWAQRGDLFDVNLLAQMRTYGAIELIRHNPPDPPHLHAGWGADSRYCEAK